MSQLIQGSKPRKPVIKRKSASSATPVMQTLEAVIIRCGCGDPDRLHPGRFGRSGVDICPRPLGHEDRGVIAFGHRNPFKRLKWWFLHDVLGLKRIDFGDVQ